MRRLMIAGLVMCAALLWVATSSAPAQQAVAITGAGATFPQPIYTAWAFEYEKLTHVKLNYQGIGSGGGIKQIKESTVDFGASDAPLKAEELNASELVQFPLIMGGVVPVVHVKGITAGQLKLTGPLLADIYMGKVARWNDEAIRKVNPDVNLPDQAITAVYRSDGSGTTWVFTNYLSKVSATWAVKVGVEKSVAWPVGVGGKGNPGVASYVQQVDGSIGYVEYAYAVENKLAHTQMENRAGKFVQPTAEAFTAAAANAAWKNAPGYYMVLTHQPGDGSWPITGASFILVHKNIKGAQTAKAMFKFFDWCYHKGTEAAAKLYYVPIPENVYMMVEETWKSDIRADGMPVWP